MQRFLLTFAIIITAGSGALAGVPLYPTQDCGKETAQMGINQCFANNLDTANAALNKLYGKMMARQSDSKAKAQLRIAERAWVAAKDKDCTEASAEDAGGSIQSMDYSDCEIHNTDARIRELEKMAGCTGSVSTCNPK